MSDPLRLGVLYSLTGSLSVTESSTQLGALLAAEEVNAAGGAGGRTIQLIVEDYASNMSLAAVRARKLLAVDGVKAVVGGYTSSSRVAMLAEFERADALLIYPTYYEGLEQHPNVIYAGAVPNQFLLDYVDWIVANLGSRLYVVGSDYIYPRALAEMIKSRSVATGGLVVGESYVPLGNISFDRVVAEIAALQPDVVVSNIAGAESVSAFYRQFRAAGLTAARLPIAATVTAEIDLQAMGPEHGAGHYMTSTYFSSLRNSANDHYLEMMRNRFGSHAVAHVAQVGAYNAVWLYALAAARASDPSSLARLRSAMLQTTFASNPEGYPLAVCANGHTVHPAYIGRARRDGSFEVLARFGSREPEPYPPTIVAAGPESLVSEKG